MLHTHEVTGSSPVVSTRYYIEDLCNGSTPDSDSVCGGSNPSSSARSTVVVQITVDFFLHQGSAFIGAPLMLHLIAALLFSSSVL